MKNVIRMISISTMLLVFGFSIGCDSTKPSSPAAAKMKDEKMKDGEGKMKEGEGKMKDEKMMGGEGKMKEGEGKMKEEKK